jgi:hypothetical protein
MKISKCELELLFNLKFSLIEEQSALRKLKGIITTIQNDDCLRKYFVNTFVDIETNETYVVNDISKYNENLYYIDMIGKLESIKDTLIESIEVKRPDLARERKIKEILK